MPAINIDSQAPARIHGERTITIKVNTRGAWWLLQAVEAAAESERMNEWPKTESFRRAFAEQLRAHLERRD